MAHTAVLVGRTTAMAPSWRLARSSHARRPGVLDDLEVVDLDRHDRGSVGAAFVGVAFKSYRLAALHDERGMKRHALPFVFEHP